MAKFKVGIVGAEEGIYGNKFLKKFLEKPIENVDISFVIAKYGISLKFAVIETINMILKKGIRKALRPSASRIKQYLLLQYDFLCKKQNRSDVSLIELARNANIECVIFSEKIGEKFNFCQKEIIEFMSSKKPDVIISSHTGIIKNDFLNVPTKGVLNFHPGILPRYRGLRPTIWSLYNCDPVGATVHFIDEGIDTGPILKTGTIEVCNSDSLYSIVAKQSDLGGRLLYETIEGLSNNSIVPKEQKEEDGIYWKFKDLTKEKIKIAKKNIKKY